jgi:hypothetical protein
VHGRSVAFGPPLGGRDANERVVVGRGQRLA